jgi:FkbM family methyltransferase
MKEIRTGNFSGHEFKFVAHDVASILATPGATHIKGVSSTPDQAAHASWWSFEDERAVRDRHWHLSPGDVVLDIGPAFGSYTLPAAAQGATVYALEPCEFCRSILAENVEQNPDLADKVRVLPIGVHEQSGWFNPDAGQFVPDNEEGNHDLLEVKSIDDIVRGLRLKRVDYIKLDVEGAEYGALAGAKKTLAKFKPRLLVEEHEFKSAGIGQRCQKLVESQGFGYSCVRHPYHSVAHAYYEVREAKS